MEVDVVNPPDFKSCWEAVVTIRDFAAAENVDLRLLWYGWAVGQAIDVDAVV